MLVSVISSGLFIKGQSQGYLFVPG